MKDSIKNVPTVTLAIKENKDLLVKACYPTIN